MESVDFRPAMRVLVNDNMVQEFCDIYNSLPEEKEIANT